MRAESIFSIQLNGINFLKFLHIIVQILFIPVAAGCLKYDFQILLPLPIGVFIFLSIFCNFIVYIPHLLENRHNLEISFVNTAVTITKKKLRRSQSITYDVPKCTVKSGQIHDSLGWSFVFMLGFAWNFYLFSEGIKLLSVKTFYQGLPMFFYGLSTGLLYLLLWFLPDREFVITDYENHNRTVLLIPSVYFTFKRDFFVLGKKKIAQINSTIKHEKELKPKTIKSFLKENWIIIFQSCTWLTVWLLASTFTLDFYHYQFVAAFVFILLAHNIRSLIFMKSIFQINPLWIYPYWLLTLHEIGIKTWHLSAMGALSPSSIIWTLPVSWIAYTLVLISTGLEIFSNPYVKDPKNKHRILLSIIVLLDIGLQFTALLSTFRIIPFYISLIEIGPLF